MRRARWVLAAVIVLVALAGCRKGAQHPPGSGSKDAAKAYYEALIKKDWPKAYANLHAESRSRLGADEFARLAQSYRAGLGFEPEAVQIRAWDEQGAEATVHITFTGAATGRTQRYKDGISLKRGDDGWGVILPQDFGNVTGN
jgi:hypothetical protein